MTSKFDHLGFIMDFSKTTNSIFIPKYYNPEIPQRLKELESTHDLLSIDDLIKKGIINIKAGKEIGKMAYGTGIIPFVRTSDISNWEIVTDTKQGVSKIIYDQFSSKQDVKAGDILLVKDGTYLIGQTCMITEHDLPLLYQSHIYRIRVNNSKHIDPFLIIALLNSPIVKKQLRSIQFTADIIDTIGDRLKEVILPFPKNSDDCNAISDEMKKAINGRILNRELLRELPRKIQNVSGDDFEMQKGNMGFMMSYNNIKNSIFIPRYYDPSLESDLHALESSHDMVSLESLVRNKILEWETGIEIGKMAYGTGNIPFIRTSDIINWEMKSDPKQGVSSDIYEANKQDVKPNDILLVRDGTYLIGSNCIINDRECKMLFCGGLYKLRIIDKTRLDPHLLLALLNTPIVKRQIRSKQFTRDIIDTIGKRLFEVKIPVPKTNNDRGKITETVKKIISERADSRSKIEKITQQVEFLDDSKSATEENLA